MERKGITATAALILLSLSTLHAFEERLHLGGADRWPEMVRMDNIDVRTGFRGTQDLFLRDLQPPVTGATDLVLDFDRLPLNDQTGRYLVHGSDVELSAELSRVGEGAAVFRAGRGRIELEPQPGAAFRPGTFWDSLIFEFWLHPAALQDGEVLFEWDGSMRRQGRIIPQRFRVFVENRRLVWEFINIFVPADGGETSVRLTSHSGLIPRQWQHHTFRYNGPTGALEYLVDHVPEGFASATSSGTARGDIHAAYIGELGRGHLHVAPLFSGALDELRISHLPRLPVSDPVLSPARQEPGLVITRPIPLGARGARLVGFEANYRTPGDSGISFSYRVGDEIADSEGLDGEWRPFAPSGTIEQLVGGRYLQLRIEFLPDGRATGTPRLSDLVVRYEPIPPPPRPTGLVALAADGAVELEWSIIRGFDIGGYLVYYGEAPGTYFGDASPAGRSPIDVGKSTSLRVDGLSNGRSYYFAVAAYGPSGVLDSGALSTEVSARPLRAAPWR